MSNFDMYRDKLRQLIAEFLLNYRHSPYRSVLNPRQSPALITFITQLVELLCDYNLNPNERDALLADVYTIILDITGEDRES